VAEIRNRGLSRRRLIQAAAVAGVGVWQLGAALPALAGLPAPRTMAPLGATATGAATAVDPATTATLEAYADTIVPGEKRFVGDVAVAGATAGPSAAAAGALDVMSMPEVGLASSLPGLAMMLNGQAAGYAAAVGLTLDPTLPPFVALSFADRTNLVTQLVTPGRPDHPYWVLLATLSSWSFDNAASMHTVDAINSGHPGLAWINFPMPNSDGIWRFPVFSYGRRIGAISPQTTGSGSPA
jgi:hypothetical protein